MCGIAGIATSDGTAVDARHVRAMTGTLLHRGPDGEGHVVLAGCTLGHRRLSIIDLAGGAQPMADQHERWWVTFNGEIYNFPALRRELESRGLQFRTRSDTEVLVHLIAERGTGAMPQLRGMFALAAWDTRDRQLILARDRIGKKPLYWFQDTHGLYFASEIKALLTLPNCPREIDPESLDLYLTYEAVPGTRTIFKNVHRLAPASTLTWSPGSAPRIETYWSIDWTRKTTLTYDEAKDRLREVILESTQARLLADVPLGAFLSGGVDSSVVVASMAQCSSGPVKTFSIGFPQADFNETAYARTVAQRFGTQHEEFIVEPNAIDVLPTLAWHYDQPFADSSALPTYYVSRMARRHVTVALNGDGGDEWFGGYDRYRALLAHGVYRSVTTPGLRALAERATRWIPDGTRRQSVPRQVRRFLRAAREPMAEFNFRLVTQRHFDRMQRQALYSPAFADTIGAFDADDQLVQLMLDGGGRAGHDPVEQALRADTLMYLPDVLLVKVDIASMAASLETRSPLLDPAVMEFAASLPRQWKVTSRSNKKILKDAYRGILPDEILYRRKMGFSIPISRWFREELYGYAREMLLDSRSIGRGYFRPEAVEALIEDHRAARVDNSLRIWSLLMLEHWHREILESSQPAAIPASVASNQ